MKKRPAATACSNAQIKKARATYQLPASAQRLGVRGVVVNTWMVERYGKTPHCQGCLGNRKVARHTDVCRARMHKLHIKELARPPPPFPWQFHSDSELLAEFRRVRDQILPVIRAEPLPSLPVPFLGGGMLCSNMFFQYERMQTARYGKESMVDAWRRPEIYSKVLEYGKKVRAAGDLHESDHEPWRRLVFMLHPPSQFSPVTAMRIYEVFDAQRVFDPYAGWGDRCLAAMLRGCKYYGVDSNDHLKEPFKRMIKFFTPDIVANSLSVQMVSSKRPRSQRTTGAAKFDTMIRKLVLDSRQIARDLIHVDVGHKAEEIVGGKFDFDFDLVFSSPPFFNMGGDFANDANKVDGCIVERYHACESSCETFMKRSLVPVVKFCFKKNPDAWVCLYIPGGMKKALEKEVGPCRMELPIKTRSGGRLRDGAGASSSIFCWNSRFGEAAKKLAAKMKGLAKRGSVIAVPRKTTIRKRSKSLGILRNP